MKLGRLEPRPEMPSPEVNDEYVARADYEAMPLDVLDKRVFALVLANSDVEAAWEMCEMLRPRPAAHALLDTERSAFVTAIVTAYCRPFVRGSASLPPPWPDYSEVGWSEYHGVLLQERHRYVTHSDFNYRRLKISGDASGNWRTTLSMPFTMGSPADLRRIQLMCVDLAGRLKFEIDHAVPTLLRRNNVRQLTLPRRSV